MDNVFFDELQTHEKHVNAHFDFNYDILDICEQFEILLS